jgi:LytS/YehU family sensor histidine kinase
LLQPIVENAIRHGFDKAQPQLTIGITAAHRGGQLEISVRDDGNGLRDQAPRFGHGLGNVQSRLTQLHGAAASMRIAQLEPKGTELLLQLPLRA